MSVNRIYVSKKEDFALESRFLTHVFQEELGLPVEQVKVFERYDIEGLSESDFEKAKQLIFAELPVDELYSTLPVGENDHIVGREFIPGQYDQRADSTAQCLSVLTLQSNYTVRCAQFLVIKGNLTDAHMASIKKYYINPVDSQEATLDMKNHLDYSIIIPPLTPKVYNFICMNDADLKAIMQNMSLAMTIEDLTLIQKYFQSEQRNPTETEIRVLDTYWSDHCRHTTFSTSLQNISIEKSPYTKSIQEALTLYEAGRIQVAKARNKELHNPTLMDMATLAVKELRLEGKLQEMDISDEINACTIIVPVTVDGKKEEWLLLFKNETHNHPTEIEPFGGAATCLGGCIRDPLSGRAYVYQAMRVTGAGDPRQPLQETLHGKLPQKVITRDAARGYSSYGNQIGLATGEVKEYYHPGFIAKRMEVGAVLGAAPRHGVRREQPQTGDIIVLLGGDTGRDGCGGATGSSKEHTNTSLETCGTEVQKGNPLIERKIQRLFRRPEATSLIKKCNDFGAGGVAVAIGELADGLTIDLNAVPKKYDGLSGTELAISESQERMACVLSPEDVEKFAKFCAEENVKVTPVAVVTDNRRLIMHWNGDEIVNISRDFLDTNGAQQERKAHILAPSDDYFAQDKVIDIKEKWLSLMSDLNVASQQGLVERFDATIGSGTVLMPFGGKHQKTPVQGMVAKLPVLHGNTTTASIMTHGYDPYLACWSPFHGAQYAVLSSIAKLVALGGHYRKAYLTLQEYFEKLGTNETAWGKATAALLGAYQAQKELSIGAIGGKDSMSGTFMNLTVPPSLISFAVTTIETNQVISPECKEVGNKLVLLALKRKSDLTPDWTHFKELCHIIEAWVAKGYVRAAYALGTGGIAEGLTKMLLGNHLGAALCSSIQDELFTVAHGSFILEVLPNITELENDSFKKIDGIRHIGTLVDVPTITIDNISIDLASLQVNYEHTLKDIFPIQAESAAKTISSMPYTTRTKKHSTACIGKPKVLIPVFPGTNCEYDTARAFEKAGAITDIFVIRNSTVTDLETSAQEFCKKLKESQILMLPGGFSAGDEPDGSGKYIATFLRNPYLTEAVHNLLYKQDGLALGICNGFQALIKLGLVPTGYITPQNDESPTLTYNTIGRHISRMVNTKIVSVKSPWMSLMNIGDIYTVPISHGEGRFIGSLDKVKELQKNGQIATQYVDDKGFPSYDATFNPNQSIMAVEGLFSPDGRIFGKMAHSERAEEDLAQNIKGHKIMPIFASGVAYFK